MSVIEVNLKNEIGSDLGSRQKIEKLFKNINTNASKVIMNFEGVEFMGRSFAQEYLNQKHIANYEITEINLSEDIKKMFDMILELNNRL